ncbi:MAG: hypothetical protein WCC95_04810 [Candidatus Sulfotelmatobacter sp.]|jgi:hypothetical protein
MGIRLEMTSRAAALLLVIPLLTALSVGAGATSQPDGVSLVELVRAAANNEVAANNSTIKHIFRSRKQTAQGSQTRLYVETQQATAALTIAYNDKPLAPDQLSGEENRLAQLAASPEQLNRKHAQEAENAQRSLCIMKALPDAFLFEYDGEVVGADGVGGDGHKLVRLKFRPNPAFQPPSHIEQVLVGMQGVLVIDPIAKRIAQIDGSLFKEVAFGWGILGHLDKGGHFLVEQRDVGNGSWEVSHMSLAFTGKILLFKSLAIKSDETFADFRRVPNDTTFAQGVEMLKAEKIKLAQNTATVQEMTARGPSH